MNKVVERALLEPRPACARAPRLAVVSAADWDSAVAKGVTAMLLDFEEDGYFDRVFMIFPFAPRSLDLQFSPRQRLIQYGYDAFPAAKTHRWVRFALAPLLIARLVLLLRRLVREQNIDVVRATDAYWCGLLGWLASVGTKAAYCVSIHADWDQRHRLDPQHGAPKLVGSRRLAKFVERFVLRRAQLVLCIRTSLAEYTVRSGAARERTRYLPHGIDLALFTATAEDVREKFKLAQGAPLVVFVGRLARENYVYEMLDLARNLADLPDLRIVLVGGGIEEKAIRAVVATDSYLASKIVMTGFVPRTTAIALRKAATVNVVPMGGYSLIEACASGRPVVGYDVEWHAELIEHERSGLLVRAGDVEGLAEAVRRLCADQPLAERLGLAGRARAFALHDIATVRPRRIACYQELLGRGERAQP